jgi:hypothetical protein
MSTEPISQRAAEHVTAFNVDELWFNWDNGGTGIMTLRWSAHLIAELTVTFA